MSISILKIIGLCSVTEQKYLYHMILSFFFILFLNLLHAQCVFNDFIFRGLLYRSSIDCLQKTLREEGVGALYKGFIPIWLRMAPWSLTFWLTYEQVVKVMGAESW